MEGEEGGRRSEQWPARGRHVEATARERQARCAERQCMAQATHCGLMVSHQRSALRTEREEGSKSSTGSRGARAAGDSHHGKVVQDDRFVGGPCLVNPESLQDSKNLFLQVLGTKLVLNSTFSKNRFRAKNTNSQN